MCYHAPSLFSLTWRAVSPFIDPVTHKKICFVNKGAKDEVELMTQHFDLTQVGAGEAAMHSVFAAYGK